MISRDAGDESGFTLIEVIVTVLVVAIFGAMMIVFLSDSIVKSSQSIGKLKKVSNLNAIMANITQYYSGYPKWRSGTTYDANSFIVPTKRNGKYYTCNPCGPSSNNEPSWPPFTDGGNTWIESGSLKTPLDVINRIGVEGSNQNDSTYGTYHVVKNGYIKFVAHTEQDDSGCVSNCILKVTIRSDQGEALTALFIFN
jgi:prepilin-type N-terminal cleavage/methylation domain-containing protein